MTLAETSPRPRIAALDLARGAAIIAMIVYHFGWNLSFLGLIAIDLRDQSAWVWFGHAIASSFLILVGIGLVLAHGHGLKPRDFLKRLGLVAGAAVLVSAATYIVFPDQFIFFGILHAIAVFSVLALPFLRQSMFVALIAALIAASLPSFVQSEALSAPWFIWLGLGSRVPSTQDFVPVFPWFGYVLAGIALAKIVDFNRFTAPSTHSKPKQWLTWAGRKSLAIYLAHQPILFGALSLLVFALAPAQDREARGFLLSCQSQCRSTGGDPAMCSAICRCTVEGLKAEKLWSSVLSDRLEPAERSRLEAVARRCAEMSSIPR
ncbi:MAG: heparan-alpha-glucosaminide N-acetyltransferase [Rhabdaerophilum sp.]